LRPASNEDSSLGSAVFAILVLYAKLPCLVLVRLLSNVLAPTVLFWKYSLGESIPSLFTLCSLRLMTSREAMFLESPLTNCIPILCSFYSLFHIHFSPPAKHSLCCKSSMVHPQLLRYRPIDNILVEPRPSIQESSIGQYSFRKCFQQTKRSLVNPMIRPESLSRLGPVSKSGSLAEGIPIMAGDR
jgi:hypothetical protein